MAGTQVVATIDGTAYAVDFALVDADQVLRLRAFGVSMRDLVARMDNGIAELPEVVALMALSLEQRDEPADLAWLAKRVTLGSVVDLSYEVDDTPDEAALAAARALIARAEG